MKTAILTDSNSGIFPEEGDRLGIFVMPMPVILDGREYFEGISLAPKEFYRRMAECCHHRICRLRLYRCWAAGLYGRLNKRLTARRISC